MQTTKAVAAGPGPVLVSTPCPSIQIKERAAEERVEKEEAVPPRKLTGKELDERMREIFSLPGA